MTFSQNSSPVTSEKLPVPTLIIRLPKKWIPLDFHKLLDVRELFYSFVLRDVKVLYTQIALGFLWGIIKPLFIIVIFALFFEGFAKILSDGILYPLFSFSAFIPWILLSEMFTHSKINLVSNTCVMFDDIAIRVKELGKNYIIGGQQEKYLPLCDIIVNSMNAPFKQFRRAPLSIEFWVLKDVLMK